MAEGWRALAICKNHGLPVRTLERTWDVEDGEPSGPYWSLVFRPLTQLDAVFTSAVAPGSGNPVRRWNLLTATAVVVIVVHVWITRIARMVRSDLSHGHLLFISFSNFSSICALLVSGRCGGREVKPRKANLTPSLQITPLIVAPTSATCLFQLIRITGPFWPKGNQGRVMTAPRKGFGIPAELTAGRIQVRLPWWKLSNDGQKLVGRRSANSYRRASVASGDALSNLLQRARDEGASLFGKTQTQSQPTRLSWLTFNSRKLEPQAFPQVCDGFFHIPAHGVRRKNVLEKNHFIRSDELVPTGVG